MVDLPRITSVLGAGTYPAHFEPKLRGPCDELGATRTLLTMGRLELNRATASERTDFGRGGVIDVSPDPAAIVNAVGHLGSDQVAESNRAYWEPLVHAMVHRVVQAHTAARLVDGQTLWLQGFNTGHGLPAADALRSLRQRLDRMFVVAATTMPDSLDKRERLRDGDHRLFVRLKDEGVVECTFLTDNLSPFRLAFSLDTQDQFKARALASLLAAQHQFARNQSLAEIGRSLGRYGALVGMAFATRSIVVHEEPAGWRLLRGLVPWVPARGSASVEHLVQEARLATVEALTDPTARAIGEAIDLDKLCFLVYTVPLRRTDASSWVHFSNRIRTWLANTYPAAVPVFVSGAGCPHPRYSGAYWLQVSALFPMPDVPAPLAAVLAGKSLQRQPGARPAAPARNGKAVLAAAEAS